jgi:hypothetical protein
MISSWLNRVFTALLAIVGTGGVLSLAAFAPPAPVPAAQDPAPPEVRLQRAANCQRFLKVYADPSDFYKAPNGDTLFRTVLFREDLPTVTGQRKWIGAVRVLTDHDEPFEGLKPEMNRGCVYFQANTSAGQAKYAVLFDSLNHQVKAFNHKWFCIGYPHDPHATPEWKTVPGNCTKKWLLWLKTSQGQIPYQHVLGRSPNLDLEVNAFVEKVQADLVKRGVKPPEIDKLIASIRGPGPWFPCAQTGCCRVFD